MKKDFSEFRSYLREHGPEIDAVVNEKAASVSSDRVKRYRAQAHFEMLEVLERYHEWLNR